MCSAEQPTEEIASLVLVASELALQTQRRPEHQRAVRIVPLEPAQCGREVVPVGMDQLQPFRFGRRVEIVQEGPREQLEMPRVPLLGGAAFRVTDELAGQLADGPEHPESSVRRIGGRSVQQRRGKQLRNRALDVDAWQLEDGLGRVQVEIAGEDREL